MACADNYHACKSCPNVWREQFFSAGDRDAREALRARLEDCARPVIHSRSMHHRCMDLARPLLALLLLPGYLCACPLSAPDVLRADGFEACARGQSGMRALAEDLQVSGSAPTVVLAHTFVLAAPARVLAVADGRHYPVDAPAAALRIRFDGDESVSSVSVMDWGSSQRPVMHGFDVLADARLPAGTHLAELIASAHPSRPGRFRVGSGSTLAVLVQPLSQMASSALPGVSANIDVTTYAPAQGIDITEGHPARPLVPLLAHALRNPGTRSLEAITLAVGRGFHACDNGIDGGHGDALLGLSADATCPDTYSASWAVNDIDPDAELQAPLMLHAAHALAPGRQLELALVGSELAFGSDQAMSPSGAHENGVCWGLGSARMLSAWGGGVAGAARSGTAQACATYTWRCVASSIGTTGCPPAGSDVMIASAIMQIPPGHDGIVLFNARTRIQLDNADSFATASLRLRIDGLTVGALGMQQLAAGAAQASRTLSASHLAAPNVGVLAVGAHLVEAVVRVEGASIRHAVVPSDLALTWFD